MGMNSKKTIKLIKKNKLAFAAFGSFFAIGFGLFFYNNVIVPAPFREQLAACLEHARTLETDKDVNAAENVCFRTYPHFN